MGSRETPQIKGALEEVVTQVVNPDAENTVPSLSVQLVQTPSPIPAVTPVVDTPVKDVPAEDSEFNLTDLAKKIGPAVFHLEVKDPNGTVVAGGTAFAISADGLIITNFHVVDGGATFTARTSQGAEFHAASIASFDQTNDLALLDLKANDLPFLELGESDKIPVGTRIVVQGSPLGLSGTLSEGIISAKRTEVDESMPNKGKLLQISAPISPGSSGSPVVDRRGHVIGVATLHRAGGENLNFAVPVESVKSLRDGPRFSQSYSTPAELESPERRKKIATERACLSDPDFEPCEELIRKKDWRGALKLAKKLVEQYPGAESAHFEHGVALYGLGLWEEAEAAYRRVLTLDPKESAAMNNLGLCLQKRNKIKEAQECWRKSAAENAEDDTAWGNLARSHLMHGEFIEAIPAMDSLRNLAPLEFERLMKVMRSQKRAPKEMAALIRHFDEVQSKEVKNDPTLESESATPRELGTTLVTKFLHNGSSLGEIEEELGDYADIVNPYFDEGRKTREQIQTDLEKYREKWPTRSFQITGIDSVRQPAAMSLVVTFSFRYQTSNGTEKRSGRIKQEAEFVKAKNQWQVSGIKTLTHKKD